MIRAKSLAFGHGAVVTGDYWSYRAMQCRATVTFAFTHRPPPLFVALNGTYTRVHICFVSLVSFSSLLALCSGR